jgi:hypothetical protein
VQEVLILEELVVLVKFQVSIFGMHNLQQVAVELSEIVQQYRLLQEQLELEVVVGEVT